MVMSENLFHWPFTFEQYVFIRFGLKFKRQIVRILMDTDCAPLDADLFLFCYERDFTVSLSDNN